ncbi:hypothetical protein [Roseitranquillus sediminis]|uniref:hypothetical protein n=1 Tax=Roseitranquillus sediminis TaxID=2809051 RepID=UPI001D0C3DCA|nr:hypothetical protein [Roseitranquillus sediminis]MBM9593180.1 hypothetical protein [Roseitranquillus sediminis]
MSTSPSDRFADAASEIAALVDDAVVGSRIDEIGDEALGQVLAAAVRLYVAKAETGARLMPFGRNSAVTPTEIAIASLAMLDAGRMEVFELGLWEQMTNIRPARQTSLADVPSSHGAAA